MGNEESLFLESANNLGAGALADQIEARVKTLRTSATDETRKRVTAEAQELRARKLLAQHESLILNEIERKKKTAAYGLCINDTTTNAITQKSTAVAKNAVSQKLKQRFKDELTNLAFRHVEVELREAGGAEGVRRRARAGRQGDRRVRGAGAAARSDGRGQAPGVVALAALRRLRAG